MEELLSQSSKEAFISWRGEEKREWDRWKTFMFMIDELLGEQQVRSV